MQILGLTGPIDHGKTTLAKFILAEEPYSKCIESWEIIAEVAQELNQHFDPSIVNSNDLTSVNSWLFHLLDILPGVINIRPSYDKIEIREHEIDATPQNFEKLFVYIDRLKDNPGLAHEEIEPSNKEDHRPILQWLGGYISATLGDTVWFDEIMRRILMAEDKVEFYVITGLRYPADAACVRRHGGKIIEVDRPSYGNLDSADPTESSRSLIDADCTVINDGNLDDLADIAKAICVDIKAGKLRFEYVS
jgi:hypothetical protein